ncbi:MAG: alpha/beta fold hydrolase [Chloroflexota bacterium]|nr:alpha/beta fold hydrolase [Chloroflexota bacterium]
MSTPGAAAPDSPATIVLVHCAWAGGWIWRDIAAGLREAGHPVYVPTLSGMGELASQATPDINLDTHIDDVVTLLAHENLHQVHLVGWSYGGLVISGVAERVPERLAQLIYLDATVAANGQSGNDAEGTSAEEAADLEASGIVAGLPGFFTHEPSVGWLAASMPKPEVRAWVLANFTPQPMATYTQPLTLTNPAAARIPRTFIFCSEGKGDASNDHSVRTLARVSQDPGWRVVQVQDTHMAPVNNPAAMTATLAALVR